MKKISYIRIAQWALASTALIPLFVIPWTPISYLVPKILLFRTLVFVALCSLSIGTIVHATVRAHVSARLRILLADQISWSVGGLFLAFCLSTALANDRALAFWGSLTRQEGFVGYIFVFIAAGLFYLVFDARAWRRFMQVSVATSILLFVYQLMQLLGGAARPSSLVGNPIFLATYFLFSALFAAFLYQQDKHQSSLAAVRFSIVGICVSVLGILLTSSRGVVLGILVAVVVVAAREFHAHRLFKRVVLACTLVALLFVGTRHLAFWQYIPAFDRLATTSFSAGTAKARLIVWKISLFSVADESVPLHRKIFGWGWDNFMFMWQKEYRSELFAFDSGLFDRAHNEILDQLVMNGLVGVCAYLLLWYFIFKKAILLRKKDKIASSLFLGVFVSYQIQNIFAFDTAFTIVFLFATIAYLLFYDTIETQRTESVPGTDIKTSFLVGLSCTILIFCGFLYYRSVVVLSWQLAVFTREKITLSNGQAPRPVLEKMLAADTPTTLELRDDILSSFFNPDSSIPLTESTYVVLQQQLEGIEKYLATRPQYFYYKLDIAKGYVIKADIRQDVNDFRKAEDAFKTASLLSPNRQDVACEYALALSKHGRAGEGLVLLQTSLGAYPEIADTRYCTALVEFAVGSDHYDAALANAEYALNAGFGSEPTTLRVYKKFAQHYYEKKDIERMVVVLRRLRVLDPEQAQMCDGILAYIEQHHTLPAIVLQ